MAGIKTKLELSDNKFLQCSTDILTLSGCSKFNGGLFAQTVPAGTTSMCNVVWDSSNCQFKQTPYPNGGGSGTTLASNGLSKSGNYVVLGGSLTGDTNINGGTVYGICLNNLNYLNTISSTIKLTGSTAICLQTVSDSSHFCLQNTAGGIIRGKASSVCFGVHGSTAIHYCDDYSSLFNYLSIPNVGWVTGYTSGGTNGITNANNGLTKTGNNVLLGGTLTGDTYIDGLGVLYLGFNVPLSGYDVTSDYILNISNTTYGAQALSGVSLSSLCAGALSICTTGNIFQDYRDLGNQKGIEYFEDYSPYYNVRSLVDVGYVTGLTKSVIFGWSSLDDGSTVAGCGTVVSGASCCNTFYGVNAGKNIVDGTDNIAIGLNSLCSIVDGTDNIAIGDNSLCDNTGSFNNIGVGSQTLSKNIDGIDNIAIGYQSLNKNICGNDNFAAGYQALSQNICGCSNVAIGCQTLYNNICGYNNIAIGEVSQRNTLGNSNVAIGSQTLESNTCGNSNIAVGSGALLSNTSGSTNIGIGSDALLNNTDGSDNIGIGNNVLFFNVNGCTNIAIGSFAMYANTCGSANFAGGFNSLINNTSGCFNTSIGSATMASNTTGSNNIGIGASALHQNDNGCHNIGLGCFAGNNNQSGNYNISIGASAGCGNFSSHNIAIGFCTLSASNTGVGNIAQGLQALFSNITGCANIGIGNNVLYNNTDGFDNIGIGSNVLSSNSTGNRNVAIGFSAGFSALCDGGVYIGSNAGFTDPNGNHLHIANTGSTSLIYGEFDNQRLVVNGTLEVINTPNNYLYLGDENTDDSWRFGITGGTDLVFQRRISSVWVTKSIITG